MADLPTVDEQMAACAELAKPGPEHDKIAQFQGKWKAQVKLWMGPGDPQESTGTMTNTLVLGGRFLEQIYEDDAGMFSGRGFMGYNTAEKRYEGFWIDSMCSFFQIEHGQLDGDTWNMAGTRDYPMGGTTCTKRSVIKVIGPDSHFIEMHFKSPKGEFKGMEIQYTRA